MPTCRRLTLLLLLAPLLALAQELPLATSPEAVRTALAEGRPRVIDIRESAEHAQGVAVGARLLPLSQLEQRRAELPAKDEPLLLICRTQNRSRATAQKLRDEGHARVQYMEGGMEEWGRRGWPTVKP